MIYIEYITRPAGVDLADFQERARGQANWSTANSDDQLILNIGRTWRIGPEPTYMAVWLSPKFGLERLDDWERSFHPEGQPPRSDAFNGVLRIAAAGLYDALRPPEPLTGRLYCAEFFRPNGSSRKINRFFDERLEANPSCQLGLLAVRVGLLGPDPGGIAVWRIASFAALDSLARDLESVTKPIQVMSSGIYADVGQEIL